MSDIRPSFYVAIAAVALLCLLLGYHVISPKVWSRVKIEPVEMVVSHLQKEGNWGCIGEDYKTYFISKDGRSDYWCGVWGKPDDKISGYWHTGHMDHVVNGFRRFE